MSPHVPAGSAEYKNPEGREPIILRPGEGRKFAMGRILAVFKADGKESGNAYSISEWWLDPNTKGPGPHHHPEDNVFFVVGGTLSILVADQWIEAPTGSFVLVPGGVVHDFENRGDARAGFLTFVTPGGFEQEMPSIADYWAENPPGDAR